jgi:arylsulfatase A-like enzyme
MQSGSEPDAPQLTVRQGRWKLIHVVLPLERRVMTGSEYELYDLVQDPGELVNLAALHPDVVERLSAVLVSWYADRPREAQAGEALDIETLDPGSRALLEALGYLESESDTDARSP